MSLWVTKPRFREECAEREGPCDPLLIGEQRAEDAVLRIGRDEHQLRRDVAAYGRELVLDLRAHELQPGPESGTEFQPSFLGLELELERFARLPHRVSRRTVGPVRSAYVPLSRGA
jgi:hypothetical protein